MRASSLARARVISPSFIIPVSARASAWRAVVFERHVIEKKILQHLVVSNRWFAASHKSRIGRARLRFVGIVKVELAQVSGFKLYRHRAILFLSLEGRGNH